jgi:hypothetical protein
LISIYFPIITIIFSIDGIKDKRDASILGVIS